MFSQTTRILAHGYIQINPVFKPKYERDKWLPQELNFYNDKQY